MKSTKNAGTNQQCSMIYANVVVTSLEIFFLGHLQYLGTDDF